MHHRDLSVLKQLSVLIAEDDITAANYLSKALKNYFKIVYTANDGQQALDLLSERNINLLVTDIAMPGLDGIELAKIIRRQEKEFKRSKLPIIIITGRQHPEELIEAVKLNLIEYIVKPITNDKLLRALDELCIALQDQGVFRYHITDTDYYDYLTKSLMVDSKPIILSDLESSFMELCIKNKGKLLSKDYITEVLYDDYVSDGAIRNLISRFRKKIGADKIVTVKDLGIIFQ